MRYALIVCAIALPLFLLALAPSRADDPEAPRFLLVHEQTVRVGATASAVSVAYGRPWAQVRRHEGFESWYYDAAKAPTGGEIVLEIVIERATGLVVAVQRLEPRS